MNSIAYSQCVKRFYSISNKSMAPGFIMYTVDKFYIRKFPTEIRFVINTELIRMTGSDHLKTIPIKF